MLYNKPIHLIRLGKSGFNFLLCARHPMCLRQVTLLSHVLILLPYSDKDETHEVSGECTG